MKFEHHAIDYVRTAACSLSGYSSQQSASTYMEQDVLPAHYLYGQIQDGLDSDIEDMMQLQVSLSALPALQPCSSGHADVSHMGQTMACACHTIRSIHHQTGPACNLCTCAHPPNLPQTGRR